MKSVITNILAKKKLHIFFLFYLIMLLPLLTPLAENLNTLEVVALIVINSILFLSLAVLSVFCSSRFEKIIYSGIFIISYLPFSIYTSYLLFARVLLQKNSIISLFETNPEESKEFLAHYFSPWIVAACVAYILVCFLIIWKMKGNKRLKVKEHKASFYSALIAFSIIIVSPHLSQAVYFVTFYRMFVNYKMDLAKEERAIADRQNHPYEVGVVEKDSVPQTIVVVIGESLARNHMSLYGYGRNTNPELEKLGDSLIVYKDVVSPQVHTIPVMRSVLSLYDRDCFDNITEKPSLFELFNRAGYKTYFISNQSFGGNFSTSYDAFLDLAESVDNLSVDNQHDEIVLPALKNIMSQPGKENKLILIHLIGNHMAYEFRYTPSYNVFSNSEDSKIEETLFRDKKAIHTIDKYDNSVLYNDFVIAGMIEILKKQQERKTALIYFSDHGEEVYEVRDFSGHAYEKVSTYMCEVPFVVWFSPTFLNNRNDLFIDINRPFSTAGFLYSLSNMAGIRYKDYDASKSIFSDTFSPSDRYVGGYTYDEVKEKTERMKNK
ncbi:lipid A phosphoethanolamine transferase [Dysgonomonas sp. OttesenSCG-928-M03]|nr:lipid A phosphoethanolamine transferase [Dysgonomonas sp. OttesenSCG-928-M03]